MADQAGTRAITVEEVEALSAKGITREIIDGQWVIPDGETQMAGKQHGAISAKLNYFLVAYVIENPAGTVYADNTSYVLESDTHGVELIRVPDVSFVRTERIDREKPNSPHYQAPDLAIEIISPSESGAEIRRKLKDYLRTGTGQVWQVYPNTKEVVVYLPDGTGITYEIGQSIPGGELLPGFELDVAKIFE